MFFCSIWNQIPNLCFWHVFRQALHTAHPAIFLLHWNRLDSPRSSLHLWGMVITSLNFMVLGRLDGALVKVSLKFRKINGQTHCHGSKRNQLKFCSGGQKDKPEESQLRVLLYQLWGVFGYPACFDPPMSCSSASKRAPYTRILGGFGWDQWDQIARVNRCLKYGYMAQPRVLVPKTSLVVKQRIKKSGPQRR